MTHVTHPKKWPTDPRPIDPLSALMQSFVPFCWMLFLSVNKVCVFTAKHIIFPLKCTQMCLIKRFRTDPRGSLQRSTEPRRYIKGMTKRTGRDALGREGKDKKVREAAEYWWFLNGSLYLSVTPKFHTKVLHQTLNPTAELWCKTLSRIKVDLVLHRT